MGIRERLAAIELPDGRESDSTRRVRAGIRAFADCDRRAPTGGSRGNRRTFSLAKKRFQFRMGYLFFLRMHRAGGDLSPVRSERTIVFQPN